MSTFIFERNQNFLLASRGCPAEQVAAIAQSVEPSDNDCDLGGGLIK